MRKLPISGELIPRLGVETIHIGEHEVDVIRIFNSNNVPVFLGRKWNEKGLPNNVILPGQDISQGNRMLTLLEIQPLTIIKLKGYSKNILEWIHQLKNGMSLTLSDTSNWRYTEADGFVFGSSPRIRDFYMVLCDDDEDRYKAEAYSLDSTFFGQR